MNWVLPWQGGTIATSHIYTTRASTVNDAFLTKAVFLDSVDIVWRCDGVCECMKRFIVQSCYWTVIFGSGVCCSKGRKWPWFICQLLAPPTPWWTLFFQSRDRNKLDWWHFLTVLSEMGKTKSSWSYLVNEHFLINIGYIFELEYQKPLRTGKWDMLFLNYNMLMQGHTDAGLSPPASFILVIYIWRDIKLGPVTVLSMGMKLNENT